MANGLLTDAAVRAAKPSDRPLKLPDGRGLHLFVSPTGARLWRMRYEIRGREKLLSFGAYPTVTLAEARRMRDEAKANLKSGRDPGEEIKAQRRERGNPDDRFETLARAWFEVNKDIWSKRHAADVIGSLERDVFPFIGGRLIADLRPQDVLQLARKIEARPAIETAHRVCQRISSVFTFAAGMGMVDTNPVLVVMGALKPIRRGRQPAVVTIEEAREVLKAAESVPAHPVTKLALRLLALTAVRPGVIAGLPWTELEHLDEKEPVWQVPAERMKLKVEHKLDATRDHLVPLSRQAMEVIDTIRRVTGRGPMVFPNARFPTRPMSENAMGYLLNRAGYNQRHVPHGWRATFSTIMNERQPADRAVIEMVLAHVPENKVAAAYNRARYVDRRRELLQEWADLLLEGLPPAADLLKGARR